MNKKYRKKAYCPDTIGKNLVAQKVSCMRNQSLKSGRQGK